MRRIHFIWAFVLLGIVATVLYYYRLDPAQVSYLPQCPLYRITGWQCAGCGGQRSVHALLHGHLAISFLYNPLLYILAAYLGVGQAAQLFRGSATLQQMHAALFGKVGIIVLILIVVVFTILRNVWPICIPAY